MAFELPINQIIQGDEVMRDWPDKCVDVRGRLLVWFSCGASSAVACKLAVDKYGYLGAKLELLYCDTLAFEHPDNRRFILDVERWVGREIRVLRSEKYTDIYDVFAKTKFLVGPRGARCTTELKKKVREAYQSANDTHVFGYTSDEQSRIDRFESNNPELNVMWLLRDAGYSKQMCKDEIVGANIALPAMYLLGYDHNNCIGCVKGQKGYWNKIRTDFPDVFDRMSKMERVLGHAINRKTMGGVVSPVFLDELNPNDGDYKKEPSISCGPNCQTEFQW